MSAENWFYSNAGQQSGPVSSEVLGQLAASGQLQRGDLIWTEGMDQWVRADSRAELFPANMPAPLAYAVPGAALNYYAAPGVQAYAGFWLRFAAYIIDYLITAMAGFVVGGVAGFIIGVVASAGAASSPQAVQEAARFAGGLLGLVLTWLYYAFMESSAKQATVGKMACGIIVTDEAGQRISFGRATGRYFGMILSGLILGIGFMMAGWTQKKQALHDILAKTLVVVKRR